MGSKTPKPPLQPWERTAIAQAYREGDKVEVIAAEFGITTGRVCQIAAADGCERRLKKKIQKKS